MKYVNPTVTDAGRNLLTQTNGNGTDCTEIDQGIFSNQKNTSNKSLAQFTVNDFNMNNASVLRLPTVGVKHQTDTIQPEVNLDNSKLSVQYPVYMIGVLAHAKSDPNNEILLAVEESTDDPLILPKATDIHLNCTFALPVSLSNSDNVNIIMTEAGMVTDQDFNMFQNSVNQSLDVQSSQVSDNTNNIADIQSDMADNTSLDSLENKINSNKNDIYQDETSIVSNIAAISNDNGALSSQESSDNKALKAEINQMECDTFDPNVTSLDNLDDGTYLLTNDVAEISGNDNDSVLLHQITNVTGANETSSGLHPVHYVIYQFAIVFSTDGSNPTRTLSRERNEHSDWTPWK